MFKLALQNVQISTTKCSNLIANIQDFPKQQENLKKLKKKASTVPNERNELKEQNGLWSYG